MLVHDNLDQCFGSEGRVLAFEQFFFGIIPVFEALIPFSGGREHSLKTQKWERVLSDWKEGSSRAQSILENFSFFNTVKVVSLKNLRELVSAEDRFRKFERLVP